MGPPPSPPAFCIITPSHGIFGLRLTLPPPESYLLLSPPPTLPLILLLFGERSIFIFTSAFTGSLFTWNGMLASLRYLLINDQLCILCMTLRSIYSYYYVYYCSFSTYIYSSIRIEILSLSSYCLFHILVVFYTTDTIFR